jgi:hypothetical protein
MTDFFHHKPSGERRSSSGAISNQLQETGLCGSMSSIPFKPISRHIIKARKHFQALFKGLHKSIVTVHGQGIFLFTSHFSPLFSMAFDMGESCPLCIRLTLRLRRCGFPHSKSQENYGSFPLNCSKKYPLPVNGCHPCLAAEPVCLFSGFKAHSLQTGEAVQFGLRPKTLQKGKPLQGRI